METQFACMLNSWTVQRFNEDLQDLLEITPQKDVLFIIGDWNAKVGSQDTPGVTGRFGLGVQNETGQRLTEFCQENAPVIANTLFQQDKKTLHMDITRTARRHLKERVLFKACSWAPETLFLHTAGNQISEEELPFSWCWHFWRRAVSWVLECGGKFWNLELSLPI